MKKLFALISFVFTMSFSAQASHFAGGDLQYVFIGDSTGVAHQYLFILRLYRDVSGIPMPNQVDLHVCSSCFSTQIVPMPQYGPAQLAPTLFDCVDPNAPGTVTMEVYEYRKVVTLPGVCNDFTFMTEPLNARNGAIDNLDLPSASGNLLIEAKLNNFIGNNSSPKFVSEPVRAFCVGKEFNWKQSAIEEDGDSIYFRLIVPKGAPFNSVCSPVPFNFNAGWTYLQPIRTVAGTQLTINAQTGNINFTPSMQEVDVLAVGVQEFRYDSTYNQWLEIGEATRDMQITVSPMCSQQAQMGVVLDYTAPGTYPDPITGLPTIDYNCLDSSVVMHFSNKLDCSTISPDGTDFRLTTPTSQPIPIKEIVSVCDVNNETNQLLLKLHKPLAINGKYFLYSKTGNDGNTLLNKCGFPMAEFDTIQLNVQGCFQMQMDIKNVYINEDIHPVVEWLADTATYPTYLFDKFIIHRKDPNGPYQQVGQVINQYKNFFYDLQITPQDVDQTIYDYKVEMILNNTAMGKTRSINSILLGAHGNSCDSVFLEWNDYDGWANPSYIVYSGEDDGSGNITWTPEFNTPQANTSYVYKIDPNKDAGNYKLKVESVDPSMTYTAISNWVECGKVTPKPEDPVDPIVPNVFTPNNDGMNDLLVIKNISSWSGKRQVVIHNRWGDVVYSTDNYYNLQAWDGSSKTGAPLADGVYFIVVNLDDPATGRTFDYKGTVTIMRDK
jgi:gliding motility-associated-like protein